MSNHNNNNVFMKYYNISSSSRQKDQSEGGGVKSTSSTMFEDGVIQYERLVKEAMDSGTAETNDRSHVVRVNADVRVGEVLSLVSEGISGGQTRAQMRLPAAFLAVLDFNNRKSTFFPNLPQLTEGCDFYLTITYRDPTYSPITAASFFAEEYLMGDENNSTRPAGEVPLQAMAILGPSRSAESAVLARMGGSVPDRKEINDEVAEISKDGIPNISPTSSSSELEDRNQFPYFARTTTIDNGDAVALCYYLNKIGVRRLALLYVNDSGYGRAYMLGLRDAAARFDIRLLIVSYYNGLDESLRGATDILSEADYTYHMLIPAGGEVNWKPVLYRLMDKSLLGVPDKMWFLGGALLDAINGDLGDPLLAQGLNRSAVVHLTEPAVQAADLDARLARLIDDDELLGYFLSNQVDGPLAAYKNNMTGYRKRYENLMPSDGKVLTTYDATMALGIAACQSPHEFFTGPELYESLKGVRFGGASGEISFDNVTATRPFANVSITNIIVPEVNGTRTRGVETVMINVKDGDITTITPLVFADGSTTPPPSLDPITENMNLLSAGERAVCLVLAGLVMLSAAGCAIWTVVHRNRPNVKASQPTFLVILAVGSFIVGCSIIPTTFQEPMPPRALNAGCMLSVWLCSLGFSTAFGGLFAKTARILRVFQESKKGRRIQVRVRDVLIPMIVLLITNTILLICWTIVAPLKWVRYPIEQDSFLRTTSSVGSCMSSPDATQITFLSLTAGVNFVALCLSNWMTYQARNLPSQFNDNPYIAVANVVLLECAIIGAPIMFVTSGDPSSFNVVLALLLAIISVATLLPIILPFALKQNARDRPRNGKLVYYAASNTFNPERAICDVTHYPAQGGGDQVYGASRVRVSGLDAPTTLATTRFSTQTGRTGHSGTSSHLPAGSSHSNFPLNSSHSHFRSSAMSGVTANSLASSRVHSTLSQLPSQELLEPSTSEFASGALTTTPPGSPKSSLKSSEFKRNASPTRRSPPVANRLISQHVVPPDSTPAILKATVNHEVRRRTDDV